MRVLAPISPLRRELEPIPSGVELVSEPGPHVEMVVLGLGAVGLITLFEKLPDLRVVQAPSAGVDWLVKQVPQGVTLCRAVGVHDGPVSEWIIAAILTMHRQLPAFIEFQQRAEWNRRPAVPAPIDDLEGQVVVVVGFGSIGRALAARLVPFGARVFGVAKQPHQDCQPISALPELLPKADVVVNLLPLTAETTGFVDAAFLARMKPGALFINAGRGKTVDTNALITCLQEGSLRAALDVTDPEPLPSDHPLWRTPNLLITPHIAGSVVRLELRCFRFAGDQIRRYAAGQPLLGVVSGRGLDANPYMY